jgi:GR25 family glycosyltransferase involved in LPS biosynthesis
MERAVADDFYEANKELADSTWAKLETTFKERANGLFEISHKRYKNKGERGCLFAHWKSLESAISQENIPFCMGYS